MYLLLRALCDELGRCGIAGAVHLAGLALDAARPLARARRRLRVPLADRRALGRLLRARDWRRRPAGPRSLACTSGTAAANYLPAVIEAREARVPLIVLTADRPPELRDTGAGQTIDQIKLYGDAVSQWFAEVGVRPRDAATLRWIRALACRAVLDGGRRASRAGPPEPPAARAAGPRRAAAGGRAGWRRAPGRPSLGGARPARRRCERGGHRSSRRSSRRPAAAWWCSGAARSAPEAPRRGPSRVPPESSARRRAGPCSPTRSPAPAAPPARSRTTTRCCVIEAFATAAQPAGGPAHRRPADLQAAAPVARGARCASRSWSTRRRPGRTRRRSATSSSRTNHRPCSTRSLQEPARPTPSGRPPGSPRTGVPARRSRTCSATS